MPPQPPTRAAFTLRRLPVFSLVVGGMGALWGAFLVPRQFAFSWLLSCLFFLSLSLGTLFLLLMHHLFDAGWSVPLRRVYEHLAALLCPWLAVLFVPVVVFAPTLYPWVRGETPLLSGVSLPLSDALAGRWAWFCGGVGLCFLAWGFLTHRLRAWSFRQDETGAALCTHRMRFHAGWGLMAFALTVTLAALLWIKALSPQWWSTIFGVYFFAGCVWGALATVYLLAWWLQQGPLQGLLHEHQFYFLGSLWLAMTLFHGYIAYSQYLVIWNANLPEETAWYVTRSAGTWRGVGWLIVGGHFLLPFLLLLRIDTKLSAALMLPLCVWAWLMHWLDLAFNVLPAARPGTFAPHWLDLACFLCIGGALAEVFLRRFNAHAPFPIHDPRLGEAVGQLHPVPSAISGGELDQADALPDGPPTPDEPPGQPGAPTP